VDQRLKAILDVDREQISAMLEEEEEFVRLSTMGEFFFKRFAYEVEKSRLVDWPPDAPRKGY
jgi:hypothetical protein